MAANNRGDTEVHQEDLPPTITPEDVPPIDPAVPPPRKVTFISMDPDCKDITFSEREGISLGRLNSSTYTFKNLYISSVHCKLYCGCASDSGTDVFVLDLSSNGTWLGPRDNMKIIGRKNRRRLLPGEYLSLLDPYKPENKGKFLFRLDHPKVEERDDEAKWGKVGAVYSIGGQLGTGNFATVFLGTHKTNKAEVAVKVIDKKKLALGHDFSEKRLREEVELLRRVKHPGVVQIIDTFEDDKILSICMELVRGGDLFDYIVNSKTFTEPEARELFKQMVEALLYLHSRDVAHRDLKPENILVGTVDGFTVPPPPPGTNGYSKRDIPVEKVVLKLSDFGLAKWTGDKSTMLTYCGTPLYIAPEIQDQRPEGYTKSVDMWSIGIVLYILLAGAVPRDPHKGITFPDKYWKGISAHAKDLVAQLLAVSPSLRITLREICDHKWMEGVTIKGRELAESTPEEVSARKKQLSAAAAEGAKRAREESEGDTEVETETTMSTMDDTDERNGVEPHRKKKKAAKTAPAATWCWKMNLDAPDHQADAWKDYSPAESRKIEEAYQKHLAGKQRTVKVSEHYKIDLRNMFQWNIAEPTKQRTVKRQVV